MSCTPRGSKYRLFVLVCLEARSTSNILRLGRGEEGGKLTEIEEITANSKMVSIFIVIQKIFAEKQHKK